MIISILKIIGIILLVLLFIVLLLLNILLFVPIRYRFSGMYSDKLNGTLKVTWVPVLLKAVAEVQDNALHYYVHLLGGTVLTNGDEKLSWLGKRLFSEKNDSCVVEADGWEKQTEMFEENEKHEKRNFDYVINEEQKDNTQSQNDNLKKLKDSKNFKNSKKIRSSKKSIGDRINDFKKKLSNYIGKIKILNKKREALLKVYHSSRFGQAKKDVIKYIKSAFQLLKPDKLEGYVRFGTGDPASTGEVFGVLAMAIPVYYKFLVLEPVFEDKELYAKLEGKGKLRLISVVILLIKVVLNKNLIKVVKRVQTIMNA